MTHSAIRHTLSAIVAITLVFAFASSPASAQNKVKDNANYVAETQLPSKKTRKGLATKKHGQKTPEGLATKKSSPAAPYGNNMGGNILGWAYMPSRPR